MAGKDGSKYKLTTEQLQVLAEEISSDPQSRDYAGCTRGGIVKLLNEKPLIDNPVPQGQVDEPDVSLGKAVGRLNANEYLGIVASPVGQGILQAIATFPNIDLLCKLATELMQKLVAENLLNKERLTEIFAPGKIPDPAWQSQIPTTSRAEELLGLNGVMLEGADIEAAVAL